MFGGETTRLKYYSRLGIYKNSTGNVTFDPKTKEAWSYNWWQFVRVIKGKLVFNNYHYSNSTSSQQSCVRGVLRDLKIKIDVEVSVSGGLQKFESDALYQKYESLIQNEIIMRRKGTRPEKNKARQEEIVEIKKEIKLLRSLGAKFTKKQVDDLKRSLAESEIERIDRMKIERENSKLLRQKAREVSNNGQVFNFESLGEVS